VAEHESIEAVLLAVEQEQGKESRLRASLLTDIAVEAAALGHPKLAWEKPARPQVHPNPHTLRRIR